MFVWLTVALSCPLKVDCWEAFSFCAFFLQVIRGVMSLALYLQISSRAPQHLDLLRHKPFLVVTLPISLICPVISLDSGISIKVHPQVSLKVDVEDWCIPAWASHSTFHLWWQAHWICEDDAVCILSPLKAVQWVDSMCDSSHFHFQDLVQIDIYIYIYMLNLSQAEIKGKVMV